ncbi:MAG: hypothetical protein E6R11_04865 [Rhodocyclaceae bacterium]|jgi:hypothetical protein|nr:MAG: hypothetical protein E6R11_04865 [Rhodocyclaceae bacterium]
MADVLSRVDDVVPNRGQSRFAAHQTRISRNRSPAPTMQHGATAAHFHGIAHLRCPLPALVQPGLRGNIHAVSWRGLQ